MNIATLAFVALGTVGAVLLLAAFVLGDLLDVDHDVDGPVSLPVIAGFLGAFGFLGALGAELTASVAAGAGAGLVGAVPVAWGAARLSRSLSAMPTDGTLTAADLVGVAGVVLTRIPSEGYGEVRVYLAGQPLKLSARSDTTLAKGAPVRVVAAPSETSVVVTAAS